MPEQCLTPHERGQPRFLKPLPPLRTESKAAPEDDRKERVDVTRGVIYRPEDNGDSPDLPTIIVEDTTSQARGSSESVVVEGTDGKVYTNMAHRKSVSEGQKFHWRVVLSRAWSVGRLLLRKMPQLRLAKTDQ